MINSIENTLRHLIKDRDLIIKAINGAKNSLDESIRSDKENGIDFLGGVMKDELIFSHDRFEFRFKEDLNAGTIIIRIGLYINDSEGVWHNSLEPVGYYELETDLDGTVIDDFIKIDKAKTIGFDITSYIKRVNALMPEKYLRRNINQYEYSTYLSHAITLFQSGNFNESAWQIKRAFEYLDKNENETKIDSTYLDISKEFLHDLIKYLFKKDLLKEEILDILIAKGILTRQANH